MATIMEESGDVWNDLGLVACPWEGTGRLSHDGSWLALGVFKVDFKATRVSLWFRRDKKTEAPRMPLCSLDLDCSTTRSLPVENEKQTQQ